MLGLFMQNRYMPELIVTHNKKIREEEKMTEPQTVLLLVGKWVRNEFGTSIFESQRSLGLRVSGRTKFAELITLVTHKLDLDVRTQRVVLSYMWPAFLMMDGDRDAPPVIVNTDDDVDVFVTLRADIEQLSLCATITEISPCIDENVGSNNVLLTKLSEDGGDQASNVNDASHNGVMVVYGGKIHTHTSGSDNESETGISAKGKTFDKLPENQLVPYFSPQTIQSVHSQGSQARPYTRAEKGKGVAMDDDLQTPIYKDNTNTNMDGLADEIGGALMVYPHIVIDSQDNNALHMNIGESSNPPLVYEESVWQTIFKELRGIGVELKERPEGFETASGYTSEESIDPHEPPLENPVLSDSDNRAADPDTVMGSAMGNVERLIAEEFDPVEPLVWRDPGDPLPEEGVRGERMEGLYVGCVFKDKADCKMKLALSAIKQKYAFRTHRSSPIFVEVVCINLDCPWRVYASIIQGTSELEVRSAEFVHVCSVDDRRYYHRHATVEVLGELMKPRFVGGRRGPPPCEIQRIVHAEYQVRITYWKAWKCREIAMEKAVGSITGSYALLPSYMANLEENNPGSVCRLECDIDENGGRRFKYLFISYGATIKGLRYLRPVILIDGTHLRGRYGGCLLIASGQDGNMQTFPIAYAVVDSENDASYEWFFRCLLCVVSDDPNLVFISDRHPSINKGLAKLYPSAAHGACLVHLARNVATKFNREKLLPGLVIRCGKAYTEYECAQIFGEIQALNPACAQYLLDIGLPYWTRAYFVGNRYNIMTTNTAESLNNVLKECRELPIVAMLEAIRMSLQGWFNRRRFVASRHNHSLTPRVNKMIDPIFDECLFMKIFQISPYEFEIHDRIGAKFLVNLENKSCSCRVWDVEKIPCTHALAAGHEANMGSEDLISDKFHSGFWENTYGEVIYPFPPHVVTNPRVLPPWTKRPPGRPKKQRYKCRVEAKGGIRKRTCTRCLGRGHNKATCKKALREMQTE